MLTRNLSLPNKKASSFSQLLIDKLSDDLEIIIDASQSDLYEVSVEITRLQKDKKYNFNDRNDCAFLIQVVEELYSLLFDFSLIKKDNLLDQSVPIDSKILNQLQFSESDKQKIINLSMIVKKMLYFILSSEDPSIPKTTKTFADDEYPTLRSQMQGQSGGHLYNQAMNVIYLTKDGGRDTLSNSQVANDESQMTGGNHPSSQTFYNRNYGVNYATTGGGNGSSNQSIPSRSQTFYNRNYGVNYATTGGGNGSSNQSRSQTFYNRNYGVNYATTGGGESSNQSLPSRSQTFYNRNYGVNYATTGGGKRSLYGGKRSLYGGKRSLYGGGDGSQSSEDQTSREFAELADKSLNLEKGLQWASDKGYLNVVKSLIDKGANINADNGLALNNALFASHLDIAEYLIANGADSSIIRENPYLLSIPITEGDLEMTKFLINNGSDIHVFNNSALRFASKMGNLAIVKLLVESGANVNDHGPNDEPEDERQNALEQAGQNGHVDVAKYLIENGAEIED
jgi:hypothetical protein